MLLGAVPTLKDYLTSPAWWVSGLILAVIGGVMTIVVLRVFKSTSIRVVRYLTGRSERRNSVFLSKVTHVSGSPSRFTLLAARQSSLEAAIPVYEATALIFIFISYGVPAYAQLGAVSVGFLSMLGGISAQFRANYMFSILMAALERAEKA